MITKYERTRLEAERKHPQHISLEYRDTDCKLCYPCNTEEEKSEWNRAVMQEMISKYENPIALSQEIREAQEEE